MTSTVEELAARLRSPRSVARADQLDPATEMAQMTVFRTLPDGRCEVTLRENGVPFHHEVYESEAAAVHATEGRLFGTVPQSAEPRHLSGPPPETVEGLKDAMAELGRDPDAVTRHEVLREVPQLEGMVVFETRPDGAVRTYALERGSEHGERFFGSEGEAVAASYARLVDQHDGDFVSDVDVERMRVRAAQFRELVQQAAR